MMFDAAIRAIGLDIIRQSAVPSEPEHVLLVMTLGMTLPVGPGQVVPIAGGILRLPMTPELAIEKGEELVAAGKGEEPPAKNDTPDIVVAKSLQGIDQVERLNKQFRGGN